jgi:hypothetical protein
MIAAITHRMNVWVVFTEYLEISFSLSDDTFGKFIGLNNKRLISISRAIIFGLASRALEFTLLCNPFFCIMGILDHFSGDTLSACSLSTAYHHNRLSFCKVEPVLTIEAIQFY